MDNTYAETTTNIRIETALNMIPLEDDVKKEIGDICSIFSNQGHSGFSSAYALHYIMYCLLKNITSESEVKNLVLTSVIKDEADQETKDMQNLMFKQIWDVVSKTESFLKKHENYREFYIDILYKIFYHLPMLSKVIIEGDESLWGEPSTAENGITVQQHRQSSKIFKSTDPKTETSTIAQIDYYIFSEPGTDIEYTSSNSLIDISDCYVWSEHSVRITPKTVQMFIDEYNADGIMFVQTSDGAKDQVEPFIVTGEEEK